METVTTSLCGLCGHPMPEGEEMFNYHGYSGGCPTWMCAKCGHTSVQHCVVPSDGKTIGCAYEDCDCEDYQKPKGQPSNTGKMTETT